MENPKASAIARLKEANNILVTVSTNPSVDQLAGAIGLTLLLNKLGKHATAVFSGEVPSTIEFLQPEQTLESNTDSLRDFIIALDKAKADKLRYKVEEKQVRIFITPYRTSLSEEDLEFSHGDFNVDVVVALGVHEQQDLDQAIVAHGRILHDATILAVNTQPNGSLGTISWVNEQASSLCEMLTDIGSELKEDILDPQMATALLTGIVAETERFSNQRTTSQTMSISAKLMAAGANQQLVAAELQVSPDEVAANDTNKDSVSPAVETLVEDSQDGEADEDGALQIDHDNPDSDDDNTEPATPGEEDQVPGDEALPDEGVETTSPEAPPQTTSRLITEPPSMGGALTASALPEDVASSTNPLSLPPVSMPLMSHETPLADSAPAIEDYQLSAPTESSEPVSLQPQDEPADQAPSIEDILAQTGDAPAEAEPDKPPNYETKSTSDQTLNDIEQAVESPHLDQSAAKVPPEPELSESATPDVDAARQAVSQAVAGDTNAPLEPIQALGAQPVNLDLGHNAQPPIASETEQSGNNYLDVTTIDEHTGLASDASAPNSNEPEASSGTTTSPLPPPPPMPPPMMPSAMTYGEQPLPNKENDNQSQEPLTPL